MKIVLIENTWSNLYLIPHGWGNGYVLIPPGHPLHGKHYDEIDVSVHEGLTFAALVTNELLTEWPVNHGLTKEDIGYWMVGFDTGHYNDNIQKWPKEAVKKETERLAEQLTALS